MTIKPIVTPQQKRVPPDADKESHGANEAGQHQHNTAHGLAHRNAGMEAQVNSKRRSDVYDELARQRRSPQKINTRAARKRNERDIFAAVNNSLGNAAPSNGHCLSGSSATSVSSTTGGVCSGSDSASSPGVSNASSNTANDSESNSSEAAGISTKLEDVCAGYNSGDEHYQPKGPTVSVEEWQKRDKKFEKIMLERGFELRNVEEDGACLFRAISLQIYGDEGMHDIIRQHTMDYIQKNREYYCHFVTEDINSYIKRKRRNDSHGNHIEIQAISEIYSRPIEVYCYAPEPINIFNSEGVRHGYSPLRLSYQRGSHYNALIDPYNATVGEGLGLAGYKPDLQAKEAVKLSEQLAIEQTMFEDKLKTTDWEATNEAIEEQIARESYLQWCRENLQKTRSTSKAISATITSAQAAEASASKYGSPYGGAGFLMGGNAKMSAARSSTITSAMSAANELAASETVASPPTTLADYKDGEPSGVIGKSAAAVAAAAAAANDLLAVAQNLSNSKKLTVGVAAASGLGVAGDGGIDSDDTDRSSTSSRSSGNSLTKRRFRKRNGTKRRIDAAVATPILRPSELSVFNVSASEAKLSKHDLLCGGAAANAADVTGATADTAAEKTSRSGTPDAEQRPCSSKQLHEHKAAACQGDADAEAAKNSATDSNSKAAAPISTFYQDLLESTYSANGYDQLTESEMLQRAIQMSTQDFIDEQNRKYFGN